MKVKGIGLLSVSAVCLSLGGAPAAAQVSLSVVHGSPAKHVLAVRGVDPWMKCVSDTVGKQVEFKYYPAGQISKTPELFRALNSGVADVAPIPIGYVSDEMPLSGVSMLPGLGSTSTEVVTAYSKAIRSGGILSPEFEKNGIVPIWVMAFPPYQIISTRGKIEKLSDFKGRVVRSAGGAMNLAVRELGGSPAEIAIGETYIALERGTADSTISAFASVKPFNLQEIMKSMSTNGAFGTFANVMSMKKDKFEKLPPAAQKAFIDCGLKIEMEMAKGMDAEAGELAKEFAARGIDIYAFTPENLAQINAALAKVQGNWVKRLADRGLPAQAALDGYKALLAK
jgi:TRAP-type transport system periplasmic protein